MSSSMNNEVSKKQINGWMCYICHPDLEEILGLDDLRAHGIGEHDLPVTEVNRYVHNSHCRDLEEEESEQAAGATAAAEATMFPRPSLGYKGLPKYIPDDDQQAGHQTTGGKTAMGEPSVNHFVQYNSDNDDEPAGMDDHAERDGLDTNNYDEPAHPHLESTQPSIFAAPATDNVDAGIEDNEDTFDDSSNIDEPERPHLGGKQPGFYVPPRVNNVNEEDDVDESYTNDRKRSYSNSPSSNGTLRTKKARVEEDGTEVASLTHDQDSSDDYNPVRGKSNKRLPQSATMTSAVTVTSMPNGTTAFPNMKCDCCLKKRVQKECHFSRFGRMCRQCSHDGYVCKANGHPVCKVIWPAWKAENPAITDQPGYASIAPTYVEADPGDRPR